MIEAFYIVFGTSSMSKQMSRSIPVHSNLCRRQLDCDCESLHRVSSTKYLGVTINDKMSWKPHIMNLTMKLRAATAIIVRLSRAVSTKTTVMVYKVLFEAHMRYGILVYASTFQTSIELIEKIQNALIRKIANVGRTSLTEINEKLGILPFKALFAQCILNKCIVKSPNATAALIDDHKALHEHDTRQAERVRPPVTRLVRRDLLYTFRYLKIHNEFTETLKFICSESLARNKKKRLMKKFIYEKSKKLKNLL